MQVKQVRRPAVERLNPLENTLLGVVCGSVEVMIMQPVLYCKNASQQNLPFTVNPAVLYRGLGVSIANMALVTGLQFPLTGMVSALFKGGSTRELTNRETVAAGCVGGALSGLVCAPMELTMIQQQRTGAGLLETPINIIRQNGAARIMRGLTMTSGREGLYTGGYLGLGPVITKVLQQDYHLSEAPAKLAGAVFTGVFSATLSHPMDTVKTCMQGDVAGQVFKNIPHAFKTLYEEGGIGRFYRGWSWRTGRTIGAVFIIAETQKYVVPVMFPHCI